VCDEFVRKISVVQTLVYVMFIQPTDRRKDRIIGELHFKKNIPMNSLIYIVDINIFLLKRNDKPMSNAIDSI